jgi:hypothetical protein
MVVKVYIWMPKVGKAVRGSVISTAMQGRFSKEAVSYGHVALEIPGRAYMSYWPPDEEMRMEGKVSAATLSYRQDKDECNGDADHTISIHNLDEDALLAYWRQTKGQPFNVWRHNCCTIATMAIHAGFNSKTREDFGFYMKAWARALLHPYHSFDVLTDDVLQILITNNEPHSMLKLVKYYKMLSD